MKYTLVMIFKTSSGKKFSLYIEGVKENLNDIEINNLMDEIIKRNIFKTSKGFLIEKSSSHILKQTKKRIYNIIKEWPICHSLY